MRSIRLSALSDMHVDELLIHSVSQNLYTVRAVLDGESCKVNKGTKPYQAMSIGQIHSDFANCDIERFTLMQAGAYDEMIGHPEEREPHSTQIAAPVESSSSIMH